MFLIVIIALACVLKYFEVSFFATLSWWWIVGMMAVAFLWFEFIEPMLGLDKRKAHDVDAERRKERMIKTFKK